jgi:hypothetical protein
MHRNKPKWRADRGARAIKRLAEIETSIAGLSNEDLLDLADIFVGKPAAPLSDIASAEMTKRNIRL